MLATIAAAAFCVSESLFMSVCCDSAPLLHTRFIYWLFFSKLFWHIINTSLTEEAKFTPGNLSQVWIFFFFFNAWQRETDCDTLMLDDFSSPSLKPVLTSLPTRNLERPVPAVHEGENMTSGTDNGSNFHTLLSRSVTFPLKVKLPDGESNVTTSSSSSPPSSI